MFSRWLSEQSGKPVIRLRPSFSLRQARPRVAELMLLRLGAKDYSLSQTRKLR